ncbi:uncharacterized protein BO80DRAFT_436684 [Aspergillus ibericus CBS 121593]|uniref:Uncharacterized protein n=1 Tax=Aspergillus ibericus CBS 121593 TaxID=1448316 RepID=A0A395GUU7_9EURO|nr:hypothetical protein BO80DRAFT_436684 [Aspergillus ibericus CBS 121593]RAK98778.1 hypothetical protein BO80DRAFT_436684 [Aspergillus ibericus CBS 121593]
MVSTQRDQPRNHHPTEAEPAHTRAQQARSFCPRELEALRVLNRKQKQSRITPRLLDTKEEQQDHAGFVPGGFIVWETIPVGILPSSWRWSKPRLEFRHIDSTTRAVWSPGKWAAWELAKPPKTCKYWWRPRDGSTEGWEW